jgi:hypothetical protein
MATKQIHVEVTQDDIDKADIKNSSRCVVATAIARSVPDATRVSVDVQSVRFTSDGERRIFLTPPAVAGYVVAFDAGDEIFPFNFRLRTDQEVAVRRRVRTEAGKAILKADSNKHNRRRQHRAAVQKRDQLAPDASHTEKQVADLEVQRAEIQLADAEQERAAVMAAYEGQRQIAPVDTSKRMPTPKVFKRTERAYGMRLLRINQSR